MPTSVTSGDSESPETVLKEKTINCNKISVSLLNARSLKTVNSEYSKLVQLQNIAGINENDVIAVTETWLNDNISDNEILYDDYQIYRRDRQYSHNARGGGILLAVRNTLKTTLVHTDETSEIIAVSVAVNKGIMFYLYCATEHHRVIFLYLLTVLMIC